MTPAGPFLAACAVLVVAGIGKITRPAAAARALGAAGFRASAGLVVALAAAEVAAGVTGAVFGGVAALAVAVWYAALTVVAARMLWRAPSTPCACLGSPTATVTRTHVVVNVAAFAVAGVAATQASPLSALTGDWLRGAVLVALTACVVKLVVLTLETLPAVDAAIRDGAIGEGTS